MNTTFFNQIAQVEFTGVLQLNISKGAENNLIVSVLLNNEQCGDNAKKLIPPLTLRGTAAELDSGFWQQISQPIEQVSALMVDMEKFQKQLEEAKKQSAIHKVSTDKTKAAPTEKDKKYRDALLKSEELEKQGKYRAAWSALPEPNGLPEAQANEVRQRRSLLAAKFEPDLFAAATETNQSNIPTNEQENQETISEDLIEDTIDEMYKDADDLEHYESEESNEEEHEEDYEDDNEE